MEPGETGNDSFLLESSEVLECSAKIMLNQDKDGALSCRICEILNSYLEQAPLLDPILPKLFADLTSVALALGVACRQSVYVVLYVAAKVRGTKNVVKLFPHDPATFRTLVKCIADVNAREGTDEVSWETHYVLLAWISAAMLVPFPLGSIMPAETVEKLYSQLYAALHLPGRVADGAAMALSNFLLRKDACRYLDSFMTDCLRGARENVKPLGLVSALARVFKVGRRELLLPYTSALLNDLDRSVDTAQTSGMLLKAKLAQRIALVCLKERVCPWRYQRGARILFGRGTVEVAGGNVTSRLDERDPKSDRSYSTVAADAELADGDGVVDITPDQEDAVEQVIDILLRGLEHRDTVVRWSCAKGIGRICARLPKEHSEDVVNTIFGLFTSPAVSRADSAWHGGCLALAELARRGLILPRTPQFDALFRIVRTAAAFDVRRGAHSVGAHVRDAACYVVWALARAYASSDIASNGHVIADTMLPVALLDREVNCRRAASAALQECVGRLGEQSIVEGIKLVTSVDYFALGDRVASYTKLAPAVAELADGLYFESLVSELWTGKLVHWDESVRALAADGLASLEPVDKKQVLLTVIFPNLLCVAVRRGDALHRHGAVLGLTALVSVVGQQMNEELIESLRAVPVTVQSKGYFRGRVGDLMRGATCALIGACARVSNGVYSSAGPGRVAANAAFDILELALGSGKEAITLAATKAYEEMCQNYVLSDPIWYEDVVRRVDQGIRQTTSLELARGFALAAGAIGSGVIALPAFRSGLNALTESTDVEIRRNAAQSLARVDLFTDPEFTERVLLALTSAMKDYTVDDRGDVGSWVREAAIVSASSIIKSILQGRTIAKESCDKICLDAVRGMVRQVCERINRTRDIACHALAFLYVPVCRLSLAGASDLPVTVRALHIVQRALRLDISEDTDFSPCDIIVTTSASFRDTAHVSHAVRNLLASELVQESAFIGTLGGCGNVAGGGSESSTTRWALDCILDHVMRRKELKTELSGIVSILASSMSDCDERLVVPTMVATEYLVRKGAFLRASSSDLLLVVQTVRNTWSGRLRDVSRVAGAVSTLCELAVAHFEESPRSAQFESGNVCRAALEALVVVLAGPVPRLRRITAEGLYVVLVDISGAYLAGQCREASHLSGPGQADEHYDAISRALDLLADTAWERLSVPVAREVRNSFCSILAVDTPQISSARVTSVAPRIERSTVR